MDSLALLSNARSSPIGVRARPIDARSIRSRSIPRRARHTRVLRSGRLRGRFGVFDGSRASVGGNRESSSVRDKSVADASPLGSLRRPPLRGAPPPPPPPARERRGSRARRQSVSRPASPRAAERSARTLPRTPSRALGRRRIAGASGGETPLRRGAPERRARWKSFPEEARDACAAAEGSRSRRRSSSAASSRFLAASPRVVPARCRAAPRR